MKSRFVKSLLEGYTTANTPYADRRKKEDAFLELEKTPFLFSSSYLNEMCDDASNKNEYETILDHMYRHEATEIESYADIEERIINKYWR